MKKESFEVILDLARSSLKTKNKTTFNELRKLNNHIAVTADGFSAALMEHQKLLPKDIRFTAKLGVVDPSVVTDYVIEKV